jgi:hypothetical protein
MEFGPMGIFGKLFDTRDAKTRAMDYIPGATADFVAKSRAMAGVLDKIPDGKEEFVIAYAVGVIDCLSQRTKLSMDDTMTVVDSYIRLVESDEKAIATILDFISVLSTKPEGQQFMKEGGDAIGRYLGGDMTALWRLRELLERKE